MKAVGSRLGHGPAFQPKLYIYRWIPPGIQNLPSSTFVISNVSYIKMASLWFCKMYICYKDSHFPEIYVDLASRNAFFAFRVVPSVYEGLF